MQYTGSSASLTSQEQLFLSVIEQLSRPLLQLTRLSELAQTTESAAATASWKLAEAISGASLQLAESYALSLRVHGQAIALRLESVAVSSLLYDAAHELEGYAKQYGVALELDTGPRLQPIVTDRRIMQAALRSLGQVFVLAQAETEATSAVRLSAHRSRYGIVTGLYGASSALGSDSLRLAKALRGRARQPLQRLVSGPAAGVFVADSLLEVMSARLHVARYHKMTGLATTLQPSRQLTFI